MNIAAQVDVDQSLEMNRFVITLTGIQVT